VRRSAGKRAETLARQPTTIAVPNGIGLSLIYARTVVVQLPLDLPNGSYQLAAQSTSITDLAGNALANSVSMNFNRVRADVTGDDRVNFADLLILAQNYNQFGRTRSQGDLNYDGSVDFADLLILAQDYGSQPTTRLSDRKAGRQKRRDRSELGMA
jgi:hypothetical protein